MCIIYLVIRKKIKTTSMNVYDVWYLYLLFKLYNI